MLVSFVHQQHQHACDELCCTTFPEVYQSPWQHFLCCFHCSHLQLLVPSRLQCTMMCNSWYSESEAHTYDTFLALCSIKLSTNSSNIPVQQKTQNKLLKSKNNIIMYLRSIKKPCISSLSYIYASYLMYIHVLRLFKVTPFFVQSHPSLIACWFHLQNTETFLIYWTHMKGNRIVNYLQQWQLDNSSGTFCTL